jgi:hypothetical protein
LKDLFLMSHGVIKAIKPKFYLLWVTVTHNYMIIQDRLGIGNQ